MRINWYYSIYLNCRANFLNNGLIFLVRTVHPKLREFMRIKPATSKIKRCIKVPYMVYFSNVKANRQSRGKKCIWVVLTFLKSELTGQTCKSPLALHFFVKYGLSNSTTTTTTTYQLTKKIVHRVPHHFPGHFQRWSTCYDRQGARPYTILFLNKSIYNPNAFFACELECIIYGCLNINNWISWTQTTKGCWKFSFIKSNWKVS